MKNKILLFTLLFCLLFPAYALASTAQFTIGSSEYSVDGNTKTMDVEPYVKNDRVYLPVRYIAEIFNVEPVWSEKQQSILLHKNSKMVALFTIGDKIALNDSNKKIEMDVAPEMVNDRVFLPLRYVAIVFNTDILWDDRVGTVTLGNDVQTQNKTQTQVIDENTEKGDLKGTITWQYNNFIGTKPDVGAKIFLIPCNYNIDNISNEDSKLFATIGMAPKNSGLFATKANGNGNYEIKNIPAGEYVIVVSSNKTTRDFTKPVDNYTKITLQPLIKNYDIFEQFNFGLNKYEVDKVEIIPNDTIDFSYDFGNTFM